MDIISAYREVGTYRGAAQICATTHKTVRRVVERAEAGQDRPVPAPRARNFEAVTELVAKRIETSKGRISAKRLLPVAQAAGYQGSARNFRRLVADQKALWRRSNHRGRRPAVWEPGAFMVFDWADVGAGLHLFCAVLAWSRWRFVAFATNERSSTTLVFLAEALQECGGVPGKLLTDRMACLKGGVVANVVIPTPDFIRLAGHYPFTELLGA
jgi:transposase